MPKEPLQGLRRVTLAAWSQGMSCVDVTLKDYSIVLEPGSAGLMVRWSMILGVFSNLNDPVVL